MFKRKDFYWNDCKKKVIIAKNIYRTLGSDLFTDQICQSLLQMKVLEKDLAEQMKLVNFAQFCRQCAAKEGGGCCSVFMADENEALQLLMNLMAGVAVDICREDGKECYFLAEKGCILVYKPMFCLNYDCTTIKNCDSQIAFSRYESSCGNLLQEQWRLEQLLLARLQDLGQLQEAV